MRTIFHSVLRHALALVFSISAVAAGAPLVILEDGLDGSTAGPDGLVYPWSIGVPGSSGVVADGFAIGDPAGYLGGGVPGSSATCWVSGSAWVSDPTADDRPIWRATMVVGLRGSTNDREDPFAVEVYNQSGVRLVQLGFTNLGSVFAPFNRSSAEPAGVASDLLLDENSGYLVELELDFEANVWSAWIGGTAVVNAQAMAASGVAMNTASLDFSWYISTPGSPGDNMIYFDDVKVERISGPYPFIVTPPVGAVAELGDTVTLEVEASGEAELGYQWKKGGTELEGEVSATLVLSDLEADDAGSYTVVVSNARGSVESVPASVSVNVPGSRNLVEWGTAAGDGYVIPPGITDWIQVACGKSTGGGTMVTLGLRENGSVMAWGDPGNAQVSGLPPGISARHVALGTGHGLAVLRDGQIVGWGSNSYGQATPPAQDGVGARQVAAGIRHSIALMKNGTLRGWGSNYTPSGFNSSYTGQATVPENGFYEAIDCGYYHGIALRNVGYGGAIDAWGSNGWGQRNVPYLSGVKAIAAGAYHNLAVDGSGAVVAWGRNEEGQCNVPAGLSDVVSVAAGFNWSAALKADGTVVSWGGNGAGEAPPPAGLSNVRLIAGGAYSAAAIFGNPFSPVFARQPVDQTISYNSAATFSVDAFMSATQGTPPPYISLRWHEGAAGDFSMPVTSYGGTLADFITRKLDEETDFWVRAYTTGAGGEITSSTASETVTAQMSAVPVAQSWSPPTAILSGDSGSIRFEFGAGAPFTVEWFKDGEPVSGGTVSGFVATLAIAEFDESDAGIYHAVVTNDLGFAESGPITVEERVGPPDLSIQVLMDLEKSPQLPYSFNAGWHRAAGVPGLAVFSSLEKTYIKTGEGEVIEIRNQNASALFALNGGIVGSDWTGVFGVTPPAEAAVQLASVSSVSWIGELDGFLYFTAWSNDLGMELWRTDGTPDGTGPVIDLNPGTGSGVTGAGSSNIRVFNGKILFVGNNGTSGTELFITDGTVGGTQLLADIWPGASGSSPRLLAATDDLMMFRAQTAATGEEIWVTDGTSAGTKMLADYRPGTASSTSSTPGVWNDQFVFSVNNGTVNQMYRYGSGMVSPVFLGNHGSNGRVHPVPGGFLFSGVISGTTVGVELCFSDGTQAGTVLVKDVDPSSNAFWTGSGYALSPRSSNPAFLTSVGGGHLFHALINGSTTELWVTDGTTAGTVRLKEFTTSGSSSSTLFPASSVPEHQGVFVLNAGSVGSGIWVTDGTTGGTVEVAPLQRPDGGNESISSVQWIGGVLHVVGYSGSVWTWSFGDESATWLGRFQLPSSNNTISPLFVVDGKVWIYAYDKSVGPEWWEIDGAAATMQQASDLYVASSTASSNPTLLGVVGDGILFTADADGVRQLWITDAATGEPRWVGNHAPWSAVILGDFAYFSRFAETGNDIWRTDGTAEGTVRVTFRNFGYILEMAAAPSMNGLVFAAPPTQGGSSRPWFSDGTDVGTRALLEGITTIDILDPKLSLAAEINGRLVFPVTDWYDRVGNATYSRGRALVSWDGGVPIRLWTDSLSPYDMPSPFAKDDTRMFFSRTLPTTGWEPWVTDGTVAGTQLIKDTVPGSGSGDPASGAWLGGNLYYVSQGTKLWKTDGTSAGTTEVWAGNGQMIRNLTIYRGRLYFTSAADLWSSDGTGAGTALAVSSVGATYYSESGISGLLIFDDAMYLYGPIGVVRSNGKTGGTQKISTTSMGAAMAAEERLFFRPSQSLPGIGIELMVLTRLVPQVQIAGPSVFTELGGDTVRMDVTSDATDLSYQWYEGEVGDRSSPLGGNLSHLDVTVGVGTRRYWVEVKADLATASAGPFEVEGLTEMEAWARTIEPPVSGGSSPLDLTSDDDGDGREAILEFAFGTDVAVADTPAAAVRLEWIEVEGVEILALVHPRRTGAFGGVRYVVERSAGLGNDSWEPLPDQNARVRLSTISPGLEESALITGILRDEPMDRGFYRVSVMPVTAEP